MEDFLKRKLEVGDSVIVIAPKYRCYVLARIIKFTPNRVRVAFMNTWNYGGDGYYTEILQDPSQLVKVDGPELTAYLLKKMKPSTTRTFYTVETYAMRKFPGVDAYWSCMGSGPGGKTIEEARERIKKDMERIGADRLDSDVKFVITKTIETTESAEEVLGSEASFFMLK